MIAGKAGFKLVQHRRYFDYDISQFKPDPNGRIFVDKLLPGNHKLARIFVNIVSPTEKSWSTGDQTPFEIRPGETTTLDLDALEHKVTARFQWPAGMQPEPQWRIRGLWALCRSFLSQFEQTMRHGKLMLRPEYHAALGKSHSYGADLVGENQLLANEVQPGQYTFSVFVYEIVDTKGPAKIILII